MQLVVQLVLRQILDIPYHPARDWQFKSIGRLNILQAFFFTWVCLL